MLDPGVTLLSKPFSAELLLEKVRLVLDGQLGGEAAPPTERPVDGLSST